MALGADELAQLNTLIYQPGFQDAVENSRSKDLGTILQNMQTSGSAHDKWTSDEQCANLMRELSSNSEVARLKVADLSMPGDNAGQTGQNLTLVNADSEPKEMYVVFKGTEDNVEWRDNFEGLYSYDTAAQRNASDYIDRMMEGRGDDWNVVVSGHSKGGNKAMYTAVTNPHVDGCYSFDGQGFSNNFFNKYATQIAANKGKIHSYNYEGDFVSSLLRLPTDNVNFTESCQEYSTVGGILNSLLRGDGSFLPKNHAPISLFAGNDNLTLNATSTPSDYWRTINDFSNWIMGNVPEDQQEEIASFIAGCIDAMGEGSDEERRRALADFIEGHPEWLGALVGSINEYPYASELVKQLAGTDLDLDGLIDVIKVRGISVAGVANLGIDAIFLLLKNDGARPFVLQWLLNTFLGTEIDDEWLRRFNSAVNSTEWDIENGVRRTEVVQVLQEEVRDWTEARKQELLSIVDEVDSEAWWDVTRWDVRYRFESLMGWLNVDNYADNMNEYLRKQIDINGVSRADIEAAFEAAWGHDAEYAASMSGVAKSISAAAAQLDSILP
ncbi:MAG: DUF2974 domain-containing protein [Acidobacteriota bacterium]|nr:DUF2974 domain-containing protein [Acidobacteriota bacterium]